MGPSPDDSKLVFGVDYNGDEKFHVFIRDLNTMKDSYTKINNAYYSLIWSGCSNYIFYTVLDNALRPYRVYRHKVNGNEQDVLIYEDTDERFHIDLDKTMDGRFVLINSESQITSEVFYIDAFNCTENEPKSIERRVNGITYSVESHGNYWYMLTDRDEKKKNFELVSKQINNDSNNEWKTI